MVMVAALFYSFGGVVTLMVAFDPEVGVTV